MIDIFIHKKYYRHVYFYIYLLNFLNISTVISNICKYIYLFVSKLFNIVLQNNINNNNCNR